MKQETPITIKLIPHTYSHPLNISVVVSDILKRHKNHQIGLFDTNSIIKIAPSNRSFKRLFNLLPHDIVMQTSQGTYTKRLSPFQQTLQLEQATRNYKIPLSIEIHVSNQDEFLTLSNQINNNSLVSVTCPSCGKLMKGKISYSENYIFQGNYKCSSLKPHLHRTFIFNISNTHSKIEITMPNKPVS